MSLGYLCKNDVIRLTEEKKRGEFVQLKLHWNKIEIFLNHSSETTIFLFNNNGLLLRDISSFTETSPFISPNALKNGTYHVTPFLPWDKASSETQRTVSRVGRKGARNILRQGRKSPWVPTLTKPFSNGQAGWAQNALYYCAQSLNSISWVLFVCSYTTAIVSPYPFGLCTKEIHAVRKL